MGVYHEVGLCQDPSELHCRHVLWVTGGGLQYLGRERGREEGEGERGRGDPDSETER